MTFFKNSCYDLAEDLGLPRDSLAGRTDEIKEVVEETLELSELIVDLLPLLIIKLWDLLDQQWCCLNQVVRGFSKAHSLLGEEERAPVKKEG